MSIIEVQNLTKEFKVKIKKSFLKDLFKPEYKTVKAVNDISFPISEGESVAFLGPNGAGKTTTTKMMTGLIYPTNGSVKVMGFTPFERKKDFLMQMGLVMGNKAGLNWDLTPIQSFELLKKIYQIPENEYKVRIKNLTSILNIEKFLNTQVRRLSLGERMKMELMGAILHNPKVLFLDEPTIGLDIMAKQKIREFLRKIQKVSNITIVLTSHDMDDIEKVCDRVIVINEGQKVYDDSLQKLNKDYQEYKFVKFIFKNKPENLEYSLGEVIEQDSSSYSFKIAANNMPKLVAEISGKNDLLDIDIISTPLEEIISDLFKRNV